MIAQVTFGLDPVVPNNPSITFVFFIAMALLAVLGSRFGYYAYRNGLVTGQDDLRSIWWHLTLVGAAAAVFALLGLLDVVSSLETPYRRGVLLAHVVGIAYVVDRLCELTLSVDEDPDRFVPGTRFWRAGLVVVVLVVVGAAIAPNHPVVIVLETGGAFAYSTAGFLVSRAGLSATRVQGTVVDATLRHLLPVLTFATTVLLLEGTVLLLGRPVVVHIQVVFVVMTATSLMTATIKLRQHLVGM